MQNIKNNKYLYIYILQNKRRPFQEPVLNILEERALLCTFASFLCGLFLFQMNLESETPSDSTTTWAVFITLVIFALNIAFLVFALVALCRASKSTLARAGSAVSTKLGLSWFSSSGASRGSVELNKVGGLQQSPVTVEMKS